MEVWISSDFQLEEAIVLKSLSKLRWFNQFFYVRFGQSLCVDHSHSIFHLSVIGLALSVNNEDDALASWGDVFSSINKIEECRF